jgi:hypothetical protein
MKLEVGGDPVSDEIIMKEEKIRTINLKTFTQK